MVRHLFPQRLNVRVNAWLFNLLATPQPSLNRTFVASSIIPPKETIPANAQPVSVGTTATPTPVPMPVPMATPMPSQLPTGANAGTRPSIVKPATGPAKYSMRFIIVGSMSVGKSCLLLQFTDRKFAANVGPTIGVDFGSSSLNIDGENVKLQIWDTAGQEDFQAITRAYYREAAAAILVYDMTNRQSYEKLQSWLSAVKCNSTNPNIVITLVG